MSGLFTRLARLNVDTPDLAVAPARAPLFTHDVPEFPVTETARPEPQADVPDERAAVREASVRSANAPGPDTQTGTAPSAEITQAAAPSPTPRASAKVPELTVPSQRDMHAGMTGSVQLEVAGSARSPQIEPQLPGTGASRKAPSSADRKDGLPEVSMTDKVFSAARPAVQKQHASQLMPENKSQTGFNPGLNNHSRREQRAHEQGLTTRTQQPPSINISIGRIEIKAVNPVQPETRQTKQRTRNRKPAVSLDEYQKKRQQGDR